MRGRFSFQPESAAVSTKLTMVGLLATWCSFAFAICGFAQHMMVQVVYLTPSCEKFHLTNRIRKTMSMPRPVRLPTPSLACSKDSSGP